MDGEEIPVIPDFLKGVLGGQAPYLDTVRQDEEPLGVATTAPVVRGGGRCDGSLIAV